MTVSHLLAAVLCAFGTCRADTALAQVQLPRIMLGPPNAAALSDLVTYEDRWADTRRYVGGLVYADHLFRTIEDTQLRLWFTKLSSWGIELELEVGAIKEWSPIGRQTFEKEQPIWNRIRLLGGRFSSIAMDEPLGATRAFLHESDDYAVAQTVEFIRSVRQSFPEIRIGDVEPFPYIARADHLKWIERLQRALVGMGIRGLDFYRLDPNWAAFDHHGSWDDVRAIHRFCASHKIPFSLIYWAAWYPREKQLNLASDQAWYAGLMTEAGAYAQTGDSPDQYAIESWVGAPSHSVPDSDPLSLTGSVLALIRQFVNAKGAAGSAGPSR